MSDQSNPSPSGKSFSVPQATPPKIDAVGLSGQSNTSNQSLPPLIEPLSDAPPKVEPASPEELEALATNLVDQIGDTPAVAPASEVKTDPAAPTDATIAAVEPLAAGDTSSVPVSTSSIPDLPATTTPPSSPPASATLDDPAVSGDLITPPTSAAPPAPSAPANQSGVLAPANSITSSISSGQQPSSSSYISLLVQQGKISNEQYQDLLIEQASSGKNLEALIDEKQLVKETDMTKAKADFYNIPYITLADTGASPEAISQIPESVARRYQLLPFTIDKQSHQLSVAMKNPLDLAAIDFVEKKTNYKVLPYFATPSEIERMIGERYAQSLSSEVNAALKETGQSLNQQSAGTVFSREVVREAPITKIVETILGFAVKSRASDVHIEPQEDRTRVRYRIDGILTEKLILPRTVHEAVVSRVKILSDMKIDERRVPQDGRFTFLAEGQEVDLRVSSLPTVFGEKIVMRLLKKNATVPTLNELGLRDRALKDVEEAIKIPHGIVLVTGPTGSGKTTTLYSILHKINTPKINIMTLEDPVEYQMAGVNQVQVNPQVGLTFASGLRSFLRQDPNVIMVGEIRDQETAALAVQASLTGHLVFSTLHTNSAAGALPRLIDMEVEPFLLASSLTLVMGQRVVRKINQDYKEAYVPEPKVVEDVKQVLGPLYKQWCIEKNKDPEKMELFRAVANRPENEPEYLGRIAIFEVLRVTEVISRMIIEQKPSKDIEETAITKNGMQLMKQDGYLKALEGVTTVEEVLRVAEI
jgi:type IV pilus assembly protein PilB